MVVMDYLSGLVRLEPAKVQSSAISARRLLQWCKSVGMLKLWIRDTATHFKYRARSVLGTTFAVDQPLPPIFAVVYLTASLSI